VVGETQTSFVSGTHILGSALIANEVVNWLKKYKKTGTLLKLDFKKACETIDWESIGRVLEKMGFRQKLRGCIKSCLSGALI